MAQLTSVAERCAFTACGLASMGTDAEWNARASTYLRLFTLVNAGCDFGELAKANSVSDVEQMRIEATYGEQWRSIPMARVEASRTGEAALAAERAWTERYCEPYWKAARDLVLTPAPTLAAALFKVRVIEWDELDNDGPMPRDCFEIVAEDMARLEAGS